MERANGVPRMDTVMLALLGMENSTVQVLITGRMVIGTRVIFRKENFTEPESGL